MSRVLRASKVLMAAAKSTSKSSTATASVRAAPAAKPNKNYGIMRLVPVSPALEKFVGAHEISRGEVMKRIWDYIKLHQLQNPANKREIFCDTRLKTIFDGRDKVGMFEIAKVINPHFLNSK